VDALMFPHRKRFQQFLIFRRREERLAVNTTLVLQSTFVTAAVLVLHWWPF
jgi:hypothetical protein